MCVCVCLCVLTSCDASADTAVPVSSSSKSAFVDFHFIVIFLARDCECHSGGCWVITSVDCSVKFCSF